MVNKVSDSIIDVMITADGVMKIRNRFIDITNEQKMEFSFCYYFINGEDRPKIRIFVYKYNEHNYVKSIDKYGKHIDDSKEPNIVFFLLNYPELKSHFNNIDRIICDVDADIIRLNYTMGNKSEYTISEFESILL